MKDLFGQTLEVGDEVACLIKNYRGLMIATVRDILPQQIRVEYNDGSKYQPIKTYTTWPQSVVKKPK